MYKSNEQMHFVIAYTLNKINPFDINIISVHILWIDIGIAALFVGGGCVEYEVIITGYFEDQVYILVVAVFGFGEVVVDKVLEQLLRCWWYVCYHQAHIGWC